MTINWTATIAGWLVLLLLLLAVAWGVSDLATTSSARVCFCGGKIMTDLAGVPFRRLLVPQGKLTITF